MWIKYNKPNALILDSDTRILSGMSPILDEVWARWEKNPTIVALIDEGTIEVMSKEQNAGGSLLGAMKVTEAIDTVKKTTNLELLEGWVVGENRKMVAAALKDQIKAVRAPIEFRPKVGEKAAE